MPKITISVDSFSASYENCGSHEIELEIDLGEYEIDRLLALRDREMERVRAEFEGDLRVAKRELREAREVIYRARWYIVGQLHPDDEDQVDQIIGLKPWETPS